MEVSSKTFRKRRSFVVAALCLLFIGIGFGSAYFEPKNNQTDVLSEQFGEGELAKVALESLQVKGRAAKTGYTRDEFGSGWASIDGCDTRNIILQDSLLDIKLSEDNCVVISGVLEDPYTGKTINFMRGTTTSDDVQIDHVVSLSDAWQKGAQDIDFSDRVVLANDPLNLLAVDGPVNQQKGDSDAASWLPPNKDFRCRYVARQVAVKRKYRLWVTDAEKSAMKRVLNGCGEQVLPISD